MRDILVIAVVVVSVFISLRRPVFGVLTFICFGILNPHSFTWTLSETFHNAQAIAIGTIFGYLFWSEPKRFPRQREVVLLLALWGMFGISSPFAVYPEIALGHFMHVSKVFLMVFLSMSLINTEYRLHFLLRVLALSLGVFSLSRGIFAIVTGGQYIVWGPEKSFLEANNSIGLALAMNLPLLFYLLKVEANKWLRWIVRAMIIFSYPAVVCTFSRGAWLGLAAATILIVLQSQRKALAMSLAAVLIFLVLPIVAQFTSERLGNRYNDLVNYKEETSAQTRFWTWEFCRRVGVSNPLTGAGFDFYSKEVYAQYYPEFLAWRGRVASCHSTWMQIFAEHGLPGFILWVGLLGCCFFSLRQLRSYGEPSGKIPHAVYLANMVRASLVVYLITGTFVDIAYFDLFYYLVAIVVVVKELVRRAEQEASFASTSTFQVGVSSAWRAGTTA